MYRIITITLTAVRVPTNVQLSYINKTGCNSIQPLQQSSNNTKLRRVFIQKYLHSWTSSQSQTMELSCARAHNETVQWAINNSPSSGIQFQTQLSLLHNWKMIWTICQTHCKYDTESYITEMCQVYFKRSFITNKMGNICRNIFLNWISSPWKLLNVSFFEFIFNSFRANVCVQS